MDVYKASTTILYINLEVVGVAGFPQCADCNGYMCVLRIALSLVLLVS